MLVFLIVDVLPIITEFSKHLQETKARLVKKLLEQCNALLVSLPLDDVLLDVQVTLSQASQSLKVRNNQQSRLMDVKREL